MLLAAATAGCGGAQEPARELPPLEEDVLNPPSAASASTAPTAAAPEAPPRRSAVPELRSTSGRELDAYEDDVERVRTHMLKQERGSATVLRLNTDGGEENVSLIYVNQEPPVFIKDAQRWMVEMVAVGPDDTVLGHFVVVIARLRPGHFVGKQSDADVAMSISFVDGWSGRDSQTGWSINGEGWCELTLERDPADGSLRGELRGLLVANDGKSQTRIDRGYLVIQP